MKTKKQIDSMTLEEALLDFLKHIYPSDPKRVTALAHRLGWTGDGIKTLQACGDMLGVTRERLRQIESNVLQKIPEQRIYIPQIDKAIRALEKATPISLTNAARLLHDKGIAGKPFDINGLQKACNTLGKSFNLQIENTRYGEFLTKTDEAGEPGRIIYAASRLTTTSGATQPRQVAKLLREEGPDVSDKNINRVLSSVDIFRFIDKRWFWCSNRADHMDRLFHVAKKMLCVVSPQTIEQIRCGLAHVLKWRTPNALHGSLKFALVPPAYVLREVLAASEAFIVDGDMVKPKAPLSVAVELNTVERIFVEVFRSASNAALDKKSLYCASLENGLKENSFYPFLAQTPIVEDMGTGLYRLRGDKVDTDIPVS